MSESSENISPTLFLRLYTDKDGKIFLLHEGLNQSVEVTPPICEQNLKQAQYQLVNASKAAHKLEVERLEGSDEATATPQQKANRSIKEILGPKPRGPLSYAGSKLLFGFEIFFGAALVLSSIYFFSRGVAWSQDHLPEYLHWVVLALYSTAITLCVYLMITGKKRREERERIKVLFGRQGMLTLPALTLLTAPAVLASITLSLHRHGWVVFQECTGRPVEARTLTDFYMWHFLKLVPFLKINEVMKLGEPLCYSQKRVGVLILIFQALVVIPSINTVLHYWKHRRELSAPELDYHFEAGWEPTAKKTEGA